MILQEGIAFEKYARCIVLGQSEANIIRYETGQPFPPALQHRRPGGSFSVKELYERIYRDCVTLTSSLGYDCTWSSRCWTTCLR